jgi:hypothetical protein
MLQRYEICFVLQSYSLCSAILTKFYYFLTNDSFTFNCFFLSLSLLLKTQNVSLQ